MPVKLAALSKEEQTQLLTHLRKHPIYPVTFKCRQTTNGTNFPKVDGGIGQYRTYAYTPGVVEGVVSIAANYILTPNTTVDMFVLAVSYKPTFTMQDNGSVDTPQDQGSEIYQLLSNGGAINDFQVFYPLNWYLEKSQTIYMHLWVGASTITAASALMTGHVTLGVLSGGI